MIHTVVPTLERIFVNLKADHVMLQTQNYLTILCQVFYDSKNSNS